MNLLFSHLLSNFFAAPAFLRKVSHNTTIAKKTKNGTQFSRKFFLSLTRQRKRDFVPLEM